MHQMTKTDGESVVDDSLNGFDARYICETKKPENSGTLKTLRVPDIRFFFLLSHPIASICAFIALVGVLALISRHKTLVFIPSRVFPILEYGW
jgi:hypothetical protein